MLTIPAAALFTGNKCLQQAWRHRQTVSYHLYIPQQIEVFRNELTDKHNFLEKRLQFVQAVVQPTLLYGCCCWTMTRAREAQVRTIQRKMMRTIIGTKRFSQDGHLENWVDWIDRCTQIAKQAMIDAGIPDWVEEIHRRRFRWAGRIARLTDNRWTKVVLLWSATGTRKRGRPKARWTDLLNRFFKQGRQATNAFWLELAQDEASWASLEDDYVNFALGMLSDV